jgi:hypothetical protein
MNAQITETFGPTKANQFRISHDLHPDPNSEKREDFYDHLSDAI